MKMSPWWLWRPRNSRVGAGANTFLVSSWTGKATLDGAGGDDTYQFGNNWVPHDNHRLRRRGVGVLPRLHRHSERLRAQQRAGWHEITGVDGPVTSTLDYEPSASFTTDIGSVTNESGFRQGLEAVAALGDRLEDTGKLGQKLFVLNGESIGHVLDIGGILEDQGARHHPGFAGRRTLDDTLHGA